MLIMASHGQARYTFGVALEPPCKLLPLEEVPIRPSTLLIEFIDSRVQPPGCTVLGSPIAKLAFEGGLLRMGDEVRVSTVRED